MATTTVIVIVSALSIFIKVLKLFRRKISFITDISQWIGLFFYIFSITFVSFHRSTYDQCDCVSKGTWKIGAFAVFLGWNSLLIDLSKFPHTGIIINMLLSITLTFIKLIPVAALLFFTLKISRIVNFAEPSFHFS